MNLEIADSEGLERLDCPCEVCKAYDLNKVRSEAPGLLEGKTEAELEIDLEENPNRETLSLCELYAQINVLQKNLGDTESHMFRIDDEMQTLSKTIIDMLKKNLEKEYNNE